MPHDQAQKKEIKRKPAWCKRVVYRNDIPMRALNINTRTLIIRSSCWNQVQKSHAGTELRIQVVLFTDRADITNQITIKMNLVMVNGRGNQTRPAPCSSVCYTCNDILNILCLFLLYNEIWNNFAGWCILQ